MAYIEFQHVKKFYGKKNEAVIKALDDTNFTVEEGELAVILGASGAGKTTALNILGGMDQATQGEVIVAGKHLNKFSEKELVKYRRNDVGFVFQFYNLVPNLTALENVELAVQICKDYLNPEDVLKKVGLEDRMKNESGRCAEKGGPGGQDEKFSGPAFRRRAAEGGHCKGHSQES